MITIKALGDWELEVLGVPFGGPLSGKDYHNQYFDNKTNLHLDRFNKPLVHYYHGLTPEGKPDGDPEVIGETKSYRVADDGVWYRVVLDKASELAQRVWNAAKQGIARASSGSITHLARYGPDGHIENWPVVELSLMDADEEHREPANPYAVALIVTKTRYEEAGRSWPDSEPSDPDEAETVAIGEKQRAKVDRSQEEEPQIENNTEDTTMSDKPEGLTLEQVTELLDKREAEKQAAQKAQAEAEAAVNDRIKKEVDEAVERAEKRWKENAAKDRRLPGSGGAPHVTKYHGISKYDGLAPDEISLMIETLNGGSDPKIGRPSEMAYKALAVRLLDAEDKDRASKMGAVALKSLNPAIKADEVMQQDLSSYGDEWVGVAYATSLWESIRLGTFVLGKLPTTEVPGGYESIVLPLESTDPTWYKVAETTDHDSTMLFPTASVTSSKMATGNKTLTLAKGGARVPWSGELGEDSLIPFVSQLKAQLVTSGMEQLEHALIDGDTATAASTNINDIAATGAQAGTELYLLFNGFRKSPLVTTTANSRDGGVLTVADFLETVKLMGAGGLNAIDRMKVGFILDLNTHWKALELEEVKTKDSFSQPTIEGGMLTSLWGYGVNVSAQMHRLSAARKANTAGKVDQDTTSNNTKGAILAVRYDQWRFGWRRKMTMETTRYPRSDSYEITALFRCGLIQRDTEAAAISYNITV